MLVQKLLNLRILLGNVSSFQVNNFWRALGVLPVVAVESLKAESLDVHAHELRPREEVALADLAKWQRVHLRGARESLRIRALDLRTDCRSRVVLALEKGDHLLLASHCQMQVGVGGPQVDEALHAGQTGLDVDAAPPHRVQVEGVGLVQWVVGSHIHIVSVLHAVEQVEQHRLLIIYCCVNEYLLDVLATHA